MKKLRVLHITPMYPTAEEPEFAIWIKRHIETLEPFCENTVLNIRVQDENESEILVESKELHQMVRYAKTTKKWRLERLYFKLLRKKLRNELEPRNFDVINFHTAYPLLLKAHRIKGLKESKTVITEHSKDYHFNFFTTKDLSSIQKIYSRGHTLIAVSERAHRDIEKFAKIRLTQNIVSFPVDTKIFKPMDAGKREKVLLMGGYWKSPKRPFMFLEIMEALLEANPDWSVRIFGHGPMSPALEMWCEDYGQTWIGELSSEAIAFELAQCSGFVLPTDYETFSLSAAESLCCGTPVLASSVGAMSDLISDDNGVLVKREQDWEIEIIKFTKSSWNHDKIAEDAISKYAYSAVGMQYFEALKQA